MRGQVTAYIDVRSDLSADERCEVRPECGRAMRGRTNPRDVGEEEKDGEQHCERPRRRFDALEAGCLTGLFTARLPPSDLNYPFIRPSTPAPSSAHIPSPSCLIKSPTSFPVFSKPANPRWFDSEAPLQMYETFAKSPVLAQFTFSSTVLGIINRVMPQLAPESALYNLQRADSSVSSEPKRLGRGGAWRHVLALHLRKGNGWPAYCDERGKISA